MSPQPQGPDIADLSPSATRGPTVPPLSDTLSQARVSYDGPELLESDLASTPLEQFRRWYDDALAQQVTEPNAMTLATVDAAGLPSARTVLLKDAGPAGFTFFTNRTSRKGTDLAARPVAAFLLPWIQLQRQVAVRGVVEQVSDAESAAYFVTRPWGSRIGAWASHQSRAVPGRDALEQLWARLAEQYPDNGRPDDVPLPPFWGGYLVRPFEIEFWQGRPSRLHDRLVFVAQQDEAALDDAAAWLLERREP